MTNRQTTGSVGLSMVVPVYNETRRIEAGLTRILAYAKTRADRCEIVVVDDGSTDGTADDARRLLKAYPDHRVVVLPENQGKGRAVREGMLAAAGAVRLFTDIDLSVPIETADEFARLVTDGASVVIGTRKVKASQVMVHQPFYREVLGGVFRWTSRLLCAPPLTDFTCGFKAFSAEATRAIFSQSRIPAGLSTRKFCFSPTGWDF
ncbi:MAG: glycosyltransferase [Deltaproteobacteria bacterium]|nr:glycosyltransferase [Deltaproteobacteria bacterium]